MTGVLLINMGGANSPKELKVFLARMFKDPFILPFGKPGRSLLSFIISNTRYKKSWKKYLAIGGSPIIEATEQTQKSLQEKLGENYLVDIAFSYSAPLIKDSIQSLLSMGIRQLTIIPLYPQASFSTTDSVQSDVNAALAGVNNIEVNFVREFYDHPDFVNFWAKLIKDHIDQNQSVAPLLLFSAHSIPKALVDKGDTYPQAIEASAKAIAESLDCQWWVAYQSGMKRSEWIGPDVNVVIKYLALQAVSEIIIIPISFVNENLETLYDIDQQIIPAAKDILGIKNISRVNIPVADPEFINLLCRLAQAK
ncbi:MAG: ferrochelatase [Bacteroidota bacterium]